MVLFDEDLHVLLASVQENFGIDADMAMTARIASCRRSLRDDRAKKREKQEQNLRTLARQLNMARQSCDDTRASHQAREHSKAVMELDRRKFALGKNVNDLESIAHTLEGQLAKLREELEMLDNDDPTDNAVREAASDGTTLKLKVFRGLGIELEGDGAGGFKKAVVRNRATGDFNIINIEGKFTPYFYANYFWGLLQSGCT